MALVDRIAVWLLDRLLGTETAPLPDPTYRVRWIRRDGTVLYMSVVGDPRMQTCFDFTGDSSTAHRFRHRSTAQERMLGYAAWNGIPASEFEIQQN